VVWVNELKGGVAGQMDTKPMDCSAGSATQREGLLAKWILNRWTVVWVNEAMGEVAGQMDTKSMDCGLAQRVKGRGFWPSGY
jgi:hypothetical protein